MLGFGYSCISIISGVFWAILMVIAVAEAALIKYSGTSSPPLAGSYNIATSAVCHPPLDKTEVAEVLLMWGEVEDGTAGHCFPRAKDAQFPKIGRLHASPEFS